MKIGKYDISKKNMIIIGGIIFAFVIGIVLLTKKDGKKLNSKIIKLMNFLLKNLKVGKLILLEIIFITQLKYMIPIILHINFS